MCRVVFLTLGLLLTADVASGAPAPFPKRLPTAKESEVARLYQKLFALNVRILRVKLKRASGEPVVTYLYSTLDDARMFHLDCKGLGEIAALRAILQQIHDRKFGIPAR